jgi:hypothetical protein
MFVDFADAGAVADKALCYGPDGLGGFDQNNVFLHLPDGGEGNKFAAPYGTNQLACEHGAFRFSLSDGSLWKAGPVTAAHQDSPGIHAKWFTGAFAGNTPVAGSLDGALAHRTDGVGWAADTARYTPYSSPALQNSWYAATSMNPYLPNAQAAIVVGTDSVLDPYGFEFIDGGWITNTPPIGATSVAAYSGGLFVGSKDGRLADLSTSGWNTLPVTLSPTGALTNMVAIGSADVFALDVGSSTDSIVQYNGSAWSPLSSAPTANYIFSLGGSSDTDLWAGSPYTPSSHPASLWQYLWHWDGQSWTGFTASITGQQNFYSIVDNAPGDVWAAGPMSVLHYDGTNWTTYPTGFHPTAGAYLWQSATGGLYLGDGTSLLLHRGP